MDPEPVPGLDQAREHFTQIEVPLGAKARARHAVDVAILRPGWGWPRAGTLVLAGLVGAGAATAMARWQPWSEAAPPVPSAPVPSAPVPSAPVPSAPLASATQGAATSSAGEFAAPGSAPPPRRQSDAPLPGAEPSTSSRQGLVTTGRNPSRPTTTAASEGASLAEQVREYRDALALTGKDDAGAVRALRRFRAQWPEGAFDHEAELEIVAALARLGESDAASEAARAFVGHHPESARADEVRELAERKAK